MLESKFNQLYSTILKSVPSEFPIKEWNMMEYCEKEYLHYWCKVNKLLYLISTWQLGDLYSDYNRWYYCRYAGKGIKSGNKLSCISFKDIF